MSTETQDIQKEVKGYFVVFGCLLSLTAITILAVTALIKMNVTLAIVFALTISTIQASLIVSSFMHIISQKQLVYTVLILTIIFVLGLFFLPWIESWNIPQGAQYVP